MADRNTDDAANAANAGSRSNHLSIGEALDLLKAEFPDITISKIRFFEGQGLIEPERTPSGYRKFTMTDIDRLRWVLHQQHEAYLPLKVLRERMVAAEATGSVPPARPLIDSATEVHESDVVGPAHRDRGLDEIYDLDAESDDDLDGPLDPELEAAVRRGLYPQARNNRPNVAEQDSLDTSAETMGEFRHPASRARSATLRTPPVVAVPAAPKTAARRAQPISIPIQSSPDAIVTNSPLGSKNPMLGPSGGAPMSFHELAAASGLSLDDLRLLEEFGLISGKTMFDGRFYDSDALTVAKTVVAFRAFGVEPRHLRMYKSSADREAAFFAQVVSPVLHKRSDEARSKGAATLSELRRLGEQLRDVVLSQALRDVLDGR